jgi:hypothetical protein
MSRGLGRLERLILERASDGPVCLLCKTLAEDAGTSRKSMARALHSIARKYPRFALQGGLGRHHPLVLYDPSDIFSVRWASLAANSKRTVTKDDVLLSFGHAGVFKAERMDLPLAAETAFLGEHN